MSETQRILIEMFNNQIFDIYRNEEIICLADNEVRIGDQNVLTSYYDTIHLFDDLNIQANFNTLIDDIFSCSKDLKYCVGNLFLYKPYLNNPLEAVFRLGNLEVFPNIQNIYDRRYILYASIASEKLYNYWDRIGDLMNAILRIYDNERNVYFSGVIENIQEDLRDSENYIWLKDYKEGDYVSFNDIRRNVVHYRQLETYYAARHLDVLHNREEMENLQAEKESYPSKYKEQLDKSIEGFKKTIKLLGEYKLIIERENNDE